ncbi:MAG TPA: sodium:alanine symporter family protein [Vicinamibacterales bacterium]
MTESILAVDSFVWRPYVMPLVLVLVGGLLTLMTGVVQIRRFGRAARTVFGSAFGKREAGSKTITPFQALSTALAATVGNGNIGGVATAILIGGPGAVFWMWVTATLGMATKFAEAVLGVHFRVTRESGELASGPMYYISRGVPNAALGRILAVAFAFFGTVTALIGTGNMAQSNTVARTAVEATRSIVGMDMPHWIPGIVITVLVGLVLIGGLKRIAHTAEAIVPTMIVVYIGSGLTYILLNVSHLPTVFGLIFQEAFTPTAALGGFVGSTVAQTIAAGVSRGVLSNEAGLGSAPIAHGVADVKHPVEQGLVGIFEVFVDTIVVCSMTAFIILSSGMWTDPAYQQASGDLTAAAMSTSIPFATGIVALSSFLFGFSTLIGWYYYGEKCFEYLFGSGAIMLYKVTFVALIFLGAVIEVRLAWAIGTLLNGFMALPNLIGLAFLVPVVRKITRDYFDRGGREFSVAHSTTGARVA